MRISTIVSSVREVNVSRMIVCAAVMLMGCGGRGDGPELATVKGVVTLGGTPLPGAKVVFQPQNSSEVQAPSTGITDESGHFELAFNRNHQGAVTGTHLVRITTRTIMSDETGKETEVPEIVPERYNEKSELEYQVKSGINEFEITLETTPVKR